MYYKTFDNVPSRLTINITNEDGCEVKVSCGHSRRERISEVPKTWEMYGYNMGPHGHAMA